MKLLHSVAYPRNISVRRLINHVGTARQWSQWAEREPVPDLLLCSLPTPELCWTAVRYGRRVGRPVVLDVRDLWPDVFLDLAPTWSRPALRLALAPMFYLTRSACRQATALIGLTPDYVAWGLRAAGRPAFPLDRTLPMGYRRPVPDPEALQKARENWEKRGIDGSQFVVCFFGSIGRQIDLERVLHAARQLRNGPRRFRFVFCGVGDSLSVYKKEAEDCDNVDFAGWVDAAKIAALMEKAAVGLVPYRDWLNYTANIPNKPVEYLSGGLPVVSSIKGRLSELLEAHDCGATYDSADSLATLLIDLHDNRPRLRQMSENATRLYEAKFTDKKVNHDIATHLESIDQASRAQTSVPDNETDFVSVTEMSGDEVSAEQVERMAHRYRWARPACVGKDVLEVACGTGQGLGSLAAVARSVQGGDYSEPILKRARAHYGRRIPLAQFDAQHLPYGDGTLDVILCFEAMYYFPSAPKFVAECDRVLRPGGVVLIATANKDLFDFNPSPYSHAYHGMGELPELFSRFTTTCFGAFPVDQLSWRQGITRPLKKLAVMANLMPKTTGGKRGLKRLVFGRLVPMPAEIVDASSASPEPASVEPLPVGFPDRKHKVIYCVATKPDTGKIA
jgi:glycosyltransferase involved in cell wall biosynthesis/SAM-dependent methyltransferase